MSKLWLLLFVLLLVPVSSISGDTYYCSPSGAGLHDGSEGNEWTLAQLVTAMGNDTDENPYFSGDTIWLAVGDYTTGYYESIKDWDRTDWCTIRGQNDGVGVDVNDFFLYNDAGAAHNTYLKIQDVNFANSQYKESAMRFWRCRHVKIWDCNFVGTGYTANTDEHFGIYCNTGYDWDINGVSIYGTGDSLAELAGIEPNDPDSSADANDHGQAFYKGVYLIGMYGSVQVRNSTVTQCNDGIAVFMSESDANNVRLNSNTVSYFTDNAILYSNESDDIEICDNTIHHGFKFDTDAGVIGGHIDCIQPQGINNYVWQAYTDMTVSRNILYECQHQAIFLNCGDGSEDWLIENNLVYKVPSNPMGTSTAVWIYAADNVTCRNNTIIGDLLFQNGNGTITITNVSGNITHWIDIGADVGIPCTYENANLSSQRGASSTTHDWGPQSDIFTAGSGGILGAQANTELEALFADYDSNDFTLASDSNAIGIGSLTYSPALDILGNARDSGPDSGCYEYGGEAPVTHYLLLCSACVCFCLGFFVVVKLQ